MGSLNTDIEKIANEALSFFRMETSRNYLEDKKKEESLTLQYKGREIYELLQNIDDAACDEKDCVASIELKGKCLRVSNNGQPFTISTLQRLCQGGVSEKNDKYIGCKGIGFRSVLNWADGIRIYSGKGDSSISVEFSRKIAAAQFDEMMRDAGEGVRKHLQSQIEELKNKGIDSSYPIFRAPKVIDAISKDYDTVIELDVKEDIIENIKNSIEDTDRYRYILLFLPNLMKIHFDVEGSVYDYEKEDLGDGRVSLTIRQNQICVESEEFYYAGLKDKLNHKYSGSDKICMGVAIPCEPVPLKTSVLYTFFPILGLESPFPALLHATFFLTDNRNELDLNREDMLKANKEVFEKLLKFYIDTVVEKVRDERRFSLLMPRGMSKDVNERFYFKGSLGKLEKEDYFINECKHRELLYTVNATFAAGAKSPIVLDCNLNDSTQCVELFKGDGFARLVNIYNEYERAFAKRLVGEDNGAESYLFDAINKESAKWSSLERMAVFKWWNSQGYTRLPGLLKTIDGKFIETNKQPCFLSENNIPEWVKTIPEWATISVLHPDDQRELLELFKDEIARKGKEGESPKRVLPRIINKDLVDIQEQSSRQVVISPINTSVHDFAQAKKFLEWLWCVWDDSRFDDTVKNKINFFVPSKDGAICLAKDAFMGESYGNRQGSEIFESIGGYNELAKIDVDANEENLQLFLQDLGVMKYPKLRKVEKTEIRDSDNSPMSEYVKYVLQRHPLRSDIGEPSWYSVSLYSIENIDNFLKKLDTKQIIRWIFSDSELRNAIEHDVQPKDFCLEYRLHRGRQNKRHNNEWQLPSYVRYLFSSTKWLGSGGDRYSPSDLLMTNNNDLNYFGLKCISESDVDDYANGVCDKEELRRLLVLLGVKTTYLELDSDKFYGLLLALPDGDKYKEAKKISKELYRTIIDNSANIDKKYSALYNSNSGNRKRFEQEGRVLVKKGDDSCFVSIKEAFFSSSAVMNVENKYPIDVPARRGKREDFQKILCIKPFEIEYIVLRKETSCCNDAFQKELESFIPCIMAYRKGRKDEVLNLTIELVSEATIQYKENGLQTERVCGDGYTLLKMFNRHWLICIGRETEYRNLEKELIADNMVQIFNVLFNFPSKEFLNRVEQLFIYSRRQREHFIEDELGSVEEIELAKQEIRKSEEFNLKLDNIFGSEADSIRQINWNNLSISDQQSVVELLKKLGKTLHELNCLLERNISVAPYNRSEFIKRYESDILHVRSFIYTALKDNSDRHNELDSLCLGFEQVVKSYNDDAFESIDFNSLEVYETLKTNFFKDNKLECNDKVCEYLRIKEKYDDNVKALMPLFEKKVASLNDFTREKNSLLFFRGADELKSMANDFISKFEERLAHEKENDAVCNNLSSLIEKAEIGRDLSSGTVRSKVVGTKMRGAVTKAATERTERRNKRQGNVAEYIVVLKLAEKKIAEVNDFFGDSEYEIYWVSGAAKEIQTVEKVDKRIYDCSQTDDSVGYDIKLVSKDKDKTMYIEVKSSSSADCSFFMSANERDTASRTDTVNEKYRIVFVSDLKVDDSNSVPKVVFIDAALDAAFNSYPTQYNMVYDKDKMLKTK